MKYIGIDLGTSAVKLLLMDERGNVLKIVSRTYPLYFPAPGWSEQNPTDWFAEVMAGLEALTEGCDTSEIAGIGVAGQMHGLVVLDKDDKIIRPAILWNDGRTFREVDELNQSIGEDALLRNTSNIAFAGFTAPKLLWMKKNEPELFSQIDKIMLPKDYINYCLTGVFATEYSDAAGTLLLDVRNKCWSEDMLAVCGITEKQLPKLYESYASIGTLRAEAAQRLGLKNDVKVAAGAADNSAAALGTGTVGVGSCNISLGTSGTLFIPCSDYDVQGGKALHTFLHADGNYHLLGCILSAASCNQWFMEEILRETDYDKIQQEIPREKPGKNSVFFLPYLMGERSPINDTDARGAFIGMSMDTTREDMLLAVLEGVGFALRDCIEIARRQGIVITKSTICGGGAKSRLWRQITADILNVELTTVAVEEGPAYGAAILAAVACGEYADIGTCVEQTVRQTETIKPNLKAAADYDAQYRKYKQIYPALEPVFKIAKSSL
ncbi:MAG: xylulokinase [Roseburia sp.]|nr:xylulokinase [Roseburia sp.]